MNVLCIGDSITLGTGATLGNYYPDILEKMLREHYEEAKVYNDGKPGISIREYLDYILWLVDVREKFGVPSLEVGSQFDAVVVMLGTNDCRTDSGAVPETSIIDLRKLLEHAKTLTTSKGKVFACTVIPLGDPIPGDILGGHHPWVRERVDNFINPGVRNIASELGIELINVNTAFSSALKNGDALFDGIHPYNNGYKLIAETIGNEIIKKVRN